jgi:lysyl-tRNA synthetase class 2
MTADVTPEHPSEDKLYADRTAKADQLRALKVNPYANGFRPKHLTHDVVSTHNGLDEAGLAAVTESFSVAGRIVMLNNMGKAAFIRIADRSGTIQAYVRKDVLGDAQYDVFKALQPGDFVGVTGTLMRTKKGELSLTASEVVVLTKALRAPPGKFVRENASQEDKDWVAKQALADVEQRYRQRYVDLLANPDVRETFKKRSKLVKYIRSFLDARDYLEVETPMMHPLVSGAAAKPFVTHHNAFDMKLYMRIAPELYLKRLVVGGLDRVYEINRSFRNEGVSTRHNPEFTMIEFYEAYATYEDLMNLTEEMIRGAAQHVCGSTTVPYTMGEVTHHIDFGQKWARVPMMEAIRSKLPELSVEDMADVEKLRAVASRSADPKEKAAIATMNRGEVIGLLFEQHVEGTLIQPTFITQFPVEVSPLARRNDADPTITDRFELFCVGREIANAFSELNDPVDQEGRFKAQVEAKGRGQQETMDYDADYIRALEHGLPPTAGEGIGIDRLAMLLTNSPSIRDVILFPLLKPHK